MYSSGLVQDLAWSDEQVFVRIATAAGAERFVISFSATDSEARLGFKKSLANLIVKAHCAGYPIGLHHSGPDSEILAAGCGAFDICPVGSAVHNDFFCVTASGLSWDMNELTVELVFESETVITRVDPDFSRPHWVFVSALPPSIPVGRNLLRIRQINPPYLESAAVPIDVIAAPLACKRVLYSGAPKQRPYTIAFVANPTIENYEGGEFHADPILTKRLEFQYTVEHCIKTLTHSAEDLLRRDDWDREMRFVAIFDPLRGVTPENALMREGMYPLTGRLNAYLAAYDEIADIVFVIHGSTQHMGTWGYPARDSQTLPFTPFTYDGIEHRHGHFPDIPGAIALFQEHTMNVEDIRPLHEFMHAAAEVDHGIVCDLHVDNFDPDNLTGSGLFVNKKFRPSTDPVPAHFADYEGVSYSSDPTRNDVGYPTWWWSYHPELIDPTQPNLMDDYRLGTPHLCRLDRLTYAFLSDRLRAKLRR